MGLPADITELQIPGYILKTIYVIGFFRDILDTICLYIGVPQLLLLLDQHISQPELTRKHVSKAATASLGDEICPVIRFTDLVTDLEDCCTVCLADFEPDDMIRQLPNCGHVFHERCLDRWIVDCRKVTCPICRNRCVPVGYYNVQKDSGSVSVWYSSEFESSDNEWWD